jgi:hypothetical protein
MRGFFHVLLLFHDVVHRHTLCLKLQRLPCFYSSDINIKGSNISSQNLLFRVRKDQSYFVGKQEQLSWYLAVGSTKSLTRKL